VVDEPQMSDLALTQSYERADERWATATQTRDWMIVFTIGLVHFVWMLVVFLLEPGIR
jgi:hypothetical protein